VKPRAYTDEEVRAKFLRTLKEMALEWEMFPDKTVRERLEGLIFSILCVFDGVHVGLPAFDIVARPHEDDEAYHKGSDENWIPNGLMINDCSLHELFSQMRE
jgi:hypothetical protein